MDLPPGPGAPALWQTIAWMTRPGAFLKRVHAQFGDPATIRTYWTEEPMVLFSSPDGVRSVFRLDPGIAPAGRSWEFLRPFAGPHSILLLDGEEHLRERRLMQGPFHGERMQAFAPMIASLAHAELATWSGRVTALDRMRELTLEIILRVVFGARDAGEVAALRGAIDDTLATVRSLPWVLAMAVVRNYSGPTDPPRPRSPWGRFRLAVERFDALLFELLARARERAREHPAATADAAGGADTADTAATADAAVAASADDDSMLSVLLAQRDDQGQAPTDQHLRDQLVALLVGGHDSSAASLAWAFELLARHPAAQTRLREGDPAYLDAVVKESLRARPALTIAPRLLLEPAQIAGRTVPAGVQVAACLWLACRREDLWPNANQFRPERWLGEQPAPNPMSWIPFGGGVRRCAGAPFAEMEIREVLRAAAELPVTLRPARSEPERARRSMLVLVPHRGAEVLVG